MDKTSESKPEPCAAIIDREWKAAIDYLSHAVGGAEHVDAVNRAFHIASQVVKSLHGGCPCCQKGSN
jgi:hypothetical protein